MNLVMDIGNTHIKAALFNGANLIESISVSYSELSKFFTFLSKISFDHIGLTKVRNIPDDLQVFLEENRSNTIIINTDLSDLPIEIDYSTPKTLGDDRICNAIAGHITYPNENVLVIDLGTCNKYDFIDLEGVYHGGSISPGFKMRLDSMHHFTDQLPLLSPESIEQLTGDSTQNSMLTGAFHGMIGEIIFFIEQYKSNFSDLKVILTGGFATYFDKALKNHIFADPYLTLKGMNEILHIQVDK